MNRRRIVSSAHLVSERAPELSELEYGLIMAWNALQRWIVSAMAVAGYPELGPLDILVVHGTNHRERPKRLGDICFTLNVEDTHLVNYSLKKLLKAGLVQSEKRGKEVFYSTTAEGRAACEKYHEVRGDCLIDTFVALGQVDPKEISDAARTLRALSGLYDQAARSATSL